MDACIKIWFYTPGQLVRAWAGILALYAAMLAIIILTL